MMYSVEPFLSTAKKQPRQPGYPRRGIWPECRLPSPQPPQFFGDDIALSPILLTDPV